MDRSKAAPDEGSKDAGWENPGADFLQLGLARAPVGGLSAYLADQLRGAIADGRLPIGARLPPGRVLAEELRVSRGVVTEAYQRLIEDYMAPDRTLLITTHQVDEIEPLLTDIMFMRDGHLILDAPMPEIGRRYRQVIVDPAAAEAALALGPVFDETHFGRRVMLFDNADPARLEPLGQVGTPTLSDLFVALMQRPAELGAGVAA